MPRVRNPSRKPAQRVCRRACRRLTPWHDRAATTRREIVRERWQAAIERADPETSAAADQRWLQRQAAAEAAKREAGRQAAEQRRLADEAAAQREAEAMAAEREREAFEAREAYYRNPPPRPRLQFGLGELSAEAVASYRALYPGRTGLAMAGRQYDPHNGGRGLGNDLGYRFSNTVT
jgi:colicin import membrane protein